MHNKHLHRIIQCFFQVNLAECHNSPGNWSRPGRTCCVWAALMDNSIRAAVLFLGVGGFKYSWEMLWDLSRLSWECLDNLEGTVVGFNKAFQAPWVSSAAILATKGPLKPTAVDGEIEEMLAASIVTMKPQVKIVDGGAICCAFMCIHVVGLQESSLQGTNISHLGKRKIIFKSAWTGYVSSLESSPLVKIAVFHVVYSAVTL